MKKDNNPLITTRLKGKKIFFQPTQNQITQKEETPPYDIVILDYSLSNSMRSTCNLGIITTTKKLIAIKKIHPRPGTPPSNFPTHYLNYLQTLTQATLLHSPTSSSHLISILPISCISATKSYAYLIMEYCEGGTLEAELNVRRMYGKWFGLRDVLAIVRQIVDGYGQMYGKELLHQDLRVGNVFISEGGVKIGGFDLAIKLNSVQHAPIHGNPYYTAPQKYTSGYKPSPSSDIFSLGILFYELIFDEHPYCKDQRKLDNIWKNLYGNGNSSDNRKNSGVVDIVRERQRINEEIYEEIANREIRRDVQPCVICTNEKQNQDLDKLIAIISKMLHKNPQKRLTFQQLRLSLQSHFFQTQSQNSLTFVNKKPLPDKLSYVIQSQTTLQHQTLTFSPLELKDIKSINPRLYAIRYQAERCNLVANFLEGIAKRLELEIRDKGIRQQKLLETKDKLSEFNFCLTSKKYEEILKDIAQLDGKDIKLEYYRTGIDHIVNNTKTNCQYLVSTLQETHLKNPQILILLDSIPQIYNNFTSYLTSTFLTHKNQILDPKNYNFYLILTLIIDFVIKMGPHFAADQVEEFIQKLRNIQIQIFKQKTQVQEVRGKLERFGIGFAMVNLEEQ